MDIFNKKALEKLEEEKRKLERKNDELIRALADAHTDLEELTKLKDSEPEDCKRGEWCKGCAFVKVAYYCEYIPGIGKTFPRTAYMCGKGDSCKQFVQKETDNG